MLTRLRVQGFKNLVDVDVRFGPFTCIAGPNGAGKSNLFDAITFLGDLASMPIMKAASRARGTNGRISDFHSLFFKSASGEFNPMVFIAEMIVPSEVIDIKSKAATGTTTGGTGNTVRIHHVSSPAVMLAITSIAIRTTLRCWHHLGSTTIGSAWSGAELNQKKENFPLMRSIIIDAWSSRAVNMA